MRLTIPGVPPSLNQWSRLHWARQRKLKEQWEMEVWVAAVQSKAVGLMLGKAIVRITYYFDRQRPKDKDNYTPKFLMDGLVKSRVIKDDNSGCVDLDWCFAKGAKRTEIEIRKA